MHCRMSPLFLTEFSLEEQLPLMWTLFLWVFILPFCPFFFSYFISLLLYCSASSNSSLNIKNTQDSVLRSLFYFFPPWSDSTCLSLSSRLVGLTSYMIWLVFQHNIPKTQFLTLCIAHNQLLSVLPHPNKWQLYAIEHLSQRQSHP